MEQASPPPSSPSRRRRPSVSPLPSPPPSPPPPSPQPHTHRRSFAWNDDVVDDIERQRVKLLSIAEQKEIVQKFKRLLLPLFPTSPFVLGGAAELLLGVVEVFGTCEAAMDTLVSIFSVMLPPGNELPSYRSLKDIVSGIQNLDLQRLPICAACELFIFEVNDDRKHCPRSLCKKKRDKEAERELLYFPLKSQLKRLMSDDALRPYFKRAALHPVSTDGRVRSIKDSPFWKKWVIDSGFADRDGSIVLCTSGDGAPPWKKRGRFKYSVYFCSSEVINFPFKIMSDYKHRLLHYMWPGPKAAGFRQVNLANLRLIEDINQFWEPQLLLADCAPCRVLSAIWSADYPGAGEILAMEGHSARWGCHRCLFNSEKIAGRQSWTGHRAYLHASHPLQSWFEPLSELPPTPIIRTESESIILRKIARDENDSKDNRSPCFGLCGYKYTCALDKLRGNCGTHNCVCIDLMHIVLGLMKRYFIPQWKGERSPPRTAFKTSDRPDFTSDEDWKKVVEEERKKYNGQESKREQLRGEHKKLALSPAHLLEVDRRYQTVDWPTRLTNNYLPIKDTGSFTAADCLHFIIYAGPWIMEGLIPKEGNQYDLWLWFVRCITLMCQSSFSPAEATEVRRFAIQTVVLSEGVLPATEHPILWHLLIHVADDIITKGPVLWYWMFRHERFWGFLIGNIKRMTSPEIGIAMAMKRRLRPSSMRGLVDAPLLDIIMGRREGNVARAKFLVRQRSETLEGGQAGWMGAHAGRSAVVHQALVACAPRGKGLQGVLTIVEKRLLRNFCVTTGSAIGPISTVTFHDTANILGNTFSVAMSTEGRKHPLRTFVEMRHASRQWWGQVLRFVTIGDMSLVFMRVFNTHKVQEHRARDPTLGRDFVLNGLYIGDSALDCSPSNLVPEFVVSVTNIWSNCIVVPIPPSLTHRRQRTTRSATHLIIPVRREL